MENIKKNCKTLNFGVIIFCVAKCLSVLHNFHDNYTITSINFSEEIWTSIHPILTGLSLVFWNLGGGGEYETYNNDTLMVDSKCTSADGGHLEFLCQKSAKYRLEVIIRCERSNNLKISLL